MVLPPSSLWLPEGCSQNIHVPSSHACLRPTKDSKLLIGHHRTMPKPQAQLLGPFICCQQLPTSPQLTLPVSHLKLQPHINTYSPCTFLALSPLLLLKFFSWPGMHCPSSSISKTQHPSSRVASLPTLHWVRRLSFTLRKHLVHLPLSWSLPKWLITFPFSESLPCLVCGK